MTFADLTFCIDNEKASRIAKKLKSLYPMNRKQKEVIEVSYENALGKLARLVLIINAKIPGCNIPTNINCYLVLKFTFRMGYSVMYAQIRSLCNSANIL